jgi:stage III sporulation protein AG
MTGFKDLLQKFKQSETGGGKLSRKKIWWLAGLMALGALLVMVGSAGDNKATQTQEDTRKKMEIPSESASRSAMEREEDALADKLQDMLGRIEGAGMVKVTVKLASSTREDYAINTTTGSKTTQEKDQGGGTRVTTENTDSNQLVLIREGSGENPVVEQEQSAEVAGVLVVADGAANPEVKANLFQAVRVSLGVEPQKIVILPSGKGE